MKSSELRCEQIEFGSPAYRETLRLREDVLRKPLGLAWEAGAFDGEEKSFHLGCFDDGKLVGSLILKPLDAKTLKMRQVAVANDQQSRGIGTILVRFSEEFARARGFMTIVAHAREAAIRFYRRLGYEIDDDLFLEVSIPHREIRKSLPVR